jgi:hypothetical protein
VSANLKVVSIHDTNFRDPAATLRNIADEIESGKYGNVGSVGLCLLGDTFEVFGMGVDSETPSIALMLHAGFMRLSGAIEGHGK